MNPVVMVCRNALELTKAAVESVFNQNIPTQLLLVDNGSTDGTTHWIAECSTKNGCLAISYFPPVSVAKAWNHALGELFGSGEDIVLVVNNDVVLRPDTYRELLAANLPFATGVGVSTMEQIQGEFVRNDRPHPDFSCFLIRREVWENVGPFDEAFEGAYCEDLDMDLRMRKAGIMGISIGMPFFHVASGTIKNASPEEAHRIHQQADRNREYFKGKWGVGVGTREYYELLEASCPAGVSK